MGHFGYVKLELPVFHVGFLRNILTTLQCICKECCHILLEDSERLIFLQRLRNPRLDSLARKAVGKKIIDRCKKCNQCPHCQAYNGLHWNTRGAHLVVAPLALERAP